jgi:drug/metabolite transporter (DMT)-like permease
LSFFTHRSKLFLAFGVIYIIWGSTFFAVQLGLKSFPPFLFSALRLLIAGGALAVFCTLRREPFPPVSEIKKHAILGLVIFIGGIVAVVWAQQFISSSLASAIITTPFWFIVLDRQQWKYYFSNKWILGGLALGLLGVILLATFRKGRAGSTSDEMQLLGIAIIILGSFFWVAGSLFVKYKPSPTSVYVNTSIQLLSAGLFCVLLSYLNSEWPAFELKAVSTSGWLSAIYLGIVSSLIGFLSFMWLIQVQPPAIVSTYSYVNPLVATLLGWAFANENISSIQLVALGIILSGVLLVNVPNYQKIKFRKAQ